MVADLLVVPQFRREQMVEFAGGTGVIKQCQPDAGSWTYLVQMEMGPEPIMGRVGSETMIWLPETDLHPMGYFSTGLASA